MERAVLSQVFSHISVEVQKPVFGICENKVVVVEVGI